MDQTILNMLSQYQCQTEDDYVNALKEIIQQTVLLGLWRGKFFEHTAFYGGTALRILYGLNRFSEDLDFSLLTPNSTFLFDKYHEAILSELIALGFDVTIVTKVKTDDSAVKSAFLKANTLEHLIRVDAPAAIKKHYHSGAQIKIKIEIETDPPLGFNTEVKPVFQPIPFWVKTYTKPDLFAGKISAVLCRQWQTRIKGRDYYDFLWFIQQNTPVHLAHLEERLRHSGYYRQHSPLTAEYLKKALGQCFVDLDVKKAKADIIKFIKKPSWLDGWTNDLFVAALDNMTFLPNSSTGKPLA